MKTKLVALATPLLLSGFTVAFASPPHMQAGMWEITTKTEMPGMPMQMPAQTMRECYRNEDVKDAAGTLPVDRNCKLDDLKQNGNTVSWKVFCKTENGPMTGSGELTYAGKSYTGVMTVKGRVEGMDMNMISRYSARRVGDCK